MEVGGRCTRNATASAVDELISEARLAELRAMPYPLYLKTPEWRRTRAAALLRAGNACSLDVTHTDGLEVHHRTYERLGAELSPTCQCSAIPATNCTTMSTAIRVESSR